MTSTLTPTLQAIFLSFAPCFTAPGLANFSALVTGLILCHGRHTISRAIQAAGDLTGGKHHSAFYRFLSGGRWSVDELSRILLHLLLPFTGEEIVVAVDDTLCRKGGPHLFGGGVHHDACGSTYGLFTSAKRRVAFAYGHNWVVLALWIPLPWRAGRGVAVPILFRLYRSKKLCPVGQYRKRTELAADLVELLAMWLPAERRLHVVADREYASKTLVRRLPPGVRLTGSLPMNAALYAKPGRYGGMGRPRTKGRRLLSPGKLAKKSKKSWVRSSVALYGRDVRVLIKTRVCLWYTVALGKPVRVVVTRDPRGRLGDRAYFCTDPSLTAEETLVNYGRRWSVEVAFRNAKQSMGIEDPQNGWWRRKHGTRRPKRKPGPHPRGNRGRLAVERTLPLCFVAYAVTLLWYLRHGNPRRDVELAMGDAPWYRHKRDPSFSDMLAAIRRELWAKRLFAGGRAEAGAAKTRLELPGWLLAG